MPSLSPVFDQPGVKFVFMRAGQKFPPIEKEWQKANHTYQEAVLYTGNVGVMAGNGYIGLDQDKPEAFKGLKLPISTAWETRPGRQAVWFKCTDRTPELLAKYGREANHAQFVLHKDGVDVGEIKLERTYQVIPPSKKALEDGKIVEYKLFLEKPPATISLDWLLTELLKLGITFSKTKYGSTALSSEYSVMAGTAQPGRNKQLNDSALKMGQLVGSGDLTEAEVITALTAAASHTGLGLEESAATIRSGLYAGIKKPREKAASAKKCGCQSQEQENEEKTAADRIVVCADSAIKWCTPDQIAYISVKNSGHEENYRLRSRAAREWLSYQFYLDSMISASSGPVEGRVPGDRALNDALNVIEAKCKYEGATHDVYQRVATQKGKIYVDMGTPDWSYIEIAPDGWQVLPSPCPVKFARSKNMLALPTPVKGGSWMDLRALLNATDDDNWKLLVGWLMQGFWPFGPYNFLIINGEQGSAKSLMAFILKMLVDPSTADVRRPPTEEKDLMIAAQNERVLAYDNLSGLSREMSDAFCCLSTGASLGARLLYTNEEESLMSAKRPCILNGIDTIASRGDLLDRSSILNLTRIPDEMYTEEKVLRPKFEKIRGSMLWLILDATSHGLKFVDHITMPKKPRMADFAVWVAACEKEGTLPWSEGEFLNVFMTAQKTAIHAMFENDTFAQAVFSFVEKRGNEWTGSARELLIGLNAVNDILEGREPKGWPKSPNKVRGRLTRIAPHLRAAGCEWLANVMAKGTMFTITIRATE